MEMPIIGHSSFLESTILYHCKNLKEYKGIDLKILFDLIEPLSELSKMIGMKEVKENMVNQIIFFLQKLNQKETIKMIVSLCISQIQEYLRINYV